MPAGDYVQDDPQLIQHAYHSSPHPTGPGSQSAASILQSVQEQEVQFEQLTRELEAERESVANQLGKCKVGTDTGSMNSMSSTDDSYNWRGAPHPHDPDPHLDEDSDLHTPKLETSHLLDSCFTSTTTTTHTWAPRELDHRGNMNFDNMDYLPDENYHGMNPAYVSGMMNGGNPGLDRDHSAHSSHLSVQSASSNRPSDNRAVHKLNNVRGRGSLSSQDQPIDNYMSYNAINRNLDNPSPHGPSTPTRGMGTPTRFTHHDPGLGSQSFTHYAPSHYESAGYYDSRASPVHYDSHASPGHYDSRGSPMPPELYNHQLSPRDPGYPGSRGSYQGGPERGTPVDPRDVSLYPMDPEPRYGDLAPYDHYNEDMRGHSDPYGEVQGHNPQYQDSPVVADQYRDSPGIGDQYRESPGLMDRYDGRPGDDRYGSHTDDRYLPEHYGERADDRYLSGELAENRYNGSPHDQFGEPPREDYPPPPNVQYSDPSVGDPYRGTPVDDRYGDVHPDDPNGAPPYDDRFRVLPPDDRYGKPPPDDRYGGPTPDDRYGGPTPDDRYGGPSPHPDDRYREVPPDDRDSPNQFREPPRDPQQIDDGYQGTLRDDYPPDDRFHDHPPEGYREEERLRQAPPGGGLEGDGYQPQGDHRYEGLPPVHQDPFADDPFHDGQSQDGDRYRGPPEDPYARRTPSPAVGSDRYGYGGEVPARYGHAKEPLPPDNYGQHKPAPREPYEEERLRQSNYDDTDRPYDDNMRVNLTRNYADYPADDEEGSRWRNPDLQEVIELLRNPNDEIKANAAAFLQHICFMDNDMKAKTRSMDGIPPLVELLNNDFPEVHKNACGALKNLSYGKENDSNKKAIKNCGGIPCLVRLLRRPLDNDIKELATGVLWNMSSCEELKKPIIDEALMVLVNFVIIPHAGWDRRNPTVPSRVPEDVQWTTELRNATGVLRNVSSAGFEARKKLRECEGLVDSLVLLLKAALAQSNIDNKCVENCICIMRNLSFRCQEVSDPDFHKKRANTLQRQRQADKGEPAGCFGGGGKKKKAAMKNENKSDIMSPSGPAVVNSGRGMDLLWHPDIVGIYKKFMEECSNTVTLEAVAGATQNLSACDWQPSLEFRAAVRKGKALPVIVEILGMESDRVVCAAATALRNLALDERNKELIGKYAMPHLVIKLPPPGSNTTLPDDTICAVLATLQEVIKNHPDFALFLFRENGVPRLNQIAQSNRRYTARTIKFASTVLRTMWSFRELQQVYKREGYTDRNFLTVSTMPRPDSATSPPSSNVNTPYNTLSRPISNQGYDDTTLSSPYSISKANNMHKVESGKMVGYSNPAHTPHTPEPERNADRDRHEKKQPEHIPMREIGSGYAALDETPPNYNDYRQTKPPIGGVPLFPNLEPSQPFPRQREPHPGEPVYAQVNKANRRPLDDGAPPQHVTLESSGGQGGADSWV